jgi:pimeloyl-ACP methyl ester carboxylesterase
MADHSITRRTALSAAGVGVATLGATNAMAQNNPRKAFVLVHGAYHGGWCWRRVADLLEAGGHKVYAPSLTGNGDRSHLLSKDINLDTQIADIANLIT